MNTSTDTVRSNLAASLASEAKDSWQGEGLVAGRAAEGSVKGMDDLRAMTSATFSQAIGQAEDLTRRGLSRARDVAKKARERAQDLRGATEERVQSDPMKALLIAAAAGAATALIVQWLARLDIRRSH
jgi:ElaB/YqjD/DUF883 family membrane-anchored ribosome-binding protein